MWNMLVVEDESIVRIGLRYLLDWESCGIRWKFEASSGEEALEILDSEQIHIVMTDIRMPGINGLELSKRIKERKPEIPIIFLTSYDTFAYIQEALRLGAVDYIHKPTMDETEIRDALRKAIGKLEETGGTRSEIPAVDWDQYLLSLLDKYTFPQDARLPDETLLASGFWLTVFRKRDDALADSENGNLRFQAMRHLIEEYVGKDWGGLVFHRNFREVIWMAPETAKSGHTNKLKYLDNLRKKVIELLNLAVIHGSSSTYSALEQLPDAYLEALVQLPNNEQCDNLIVRHAKAYIDENLLEDIGLAKVANSLHVSPGYLSRIFQKEIGENFIDYITRNKMEHAQRLLRDTTRKVYDIAAEVGYTNPHYFSRLFKLRTGVTPHDYRNQ